MVYLIISKNCTTFGDTYNLNVVGFINHKNVPIIILSSDQLTFDKKDILYKFLIPTNDTMYFKYIYFPVDQFRIDSQGYPKIQGIFEPRFDCFAYEENKFIFKDYYITPSYIEDDSIKEIVIESKR